MKENQLFVDLIESKSKNIQDEIKLLVDEILS